MRIMASYVTKEYDFFVNELLSLLALLRFYILIRLFLFKSSYMNPRCNENLNCSSQTMQNAWMRSKLCLCSEVLVQRLTSHAHTRALWSQHHTLLVCYSNLLKVLFYST